MAGETSIDTDVTNDEIEIIPYTAQTVEDLVGGLNTNSLVQSRMLARLKGLEVIPDPWTNAVQATGTSTLNGLEAHVIGDGTGDNKLGVYGYGGTGNGVTGETTTSTGVFGKITGTGGIRPNGVWGLSEDTGSIGVRAENSGGATGVALLIVTGYISKPRVTGHNIQLWLAGVDQGVFEYAFT